MMRSTSVVLVLLLKMLRYIASDDSPFQLTNNAGFCLVKIDSVCQEIRWTTAGRLLVPRNNKCLGVQGKCVGSDVNFYDCDETSELQRWECENETVLALQGQQLYVELKADNNAVLSKTAGPNSQLTISGTSSGACSRTYRELYTIEGTTAGRPCMFPFLYETQWYSSCTLTDTVDNRPWCAVETKYDEHHTWGFCPTNAKDNWRQNPTSKAVYQLNLESALTWLEADRSCKQQSASLLSIIDPHEQAYITALLEPGGTPQGYKLWTGLTLELEHGWKWSNGNPFRYLNWDSGHPLYNPGHSCGMMDGVLRYSWQSSKCNKKLGYICYSKGVLASPTESPETGFCSAPWIPYNGHCFQLYRDEKSWSDAQLACRKDGGDLVSIRNVEDQSFVISQLGYASADELWIGLNDRKTEGLFDWSDHTTVSFTSWEFGRPAVATNQEDCVLIRGQGGNWADRDCKEKHGFICMKTSASEPSGDGLPKDEGCKTSWKRYGSYCYFIGTETKTFGEAKADCERSNSYLADVSTRIDNAFLVSLVGLRSEKHFWLGLSNQKNQEIFEWTNTVSVRYTHWNGEMPGHNQGCVAMATGASAGLWDVLPCTNREKYICKHLAEGAVVTPAPTTAPSSQCADGWTKVLTRYFCYKVYSEESERMTWFEARDYCRAIGGDLLSIHSASELRLQQRRYRNLWIGLSAPDQGTGYVWSDGSPSYTQGPSTPATKDYNVTSDGWLEWRGSQYLIQKTRMANEDARQSCKEKHGDLVTIDSEAERIFLWKQISKMSDNFWIGLTVDLDKSFQWMDGSPVIYQMWDEGQPNFANFDENCVVMIPFNGFWHDYNCGFEFRPICKRSSSPPVNATVAPTVPPKGGCKQGWKKFNYKCYKIINNQNLTWHGAREKCKDMDGNLASIPSRHVEVFLLSEMLSAPTIDLWIGLHSTYGLGFYWTDGRPKSYLNLKYFGRRWRPLILPRHIFMDSDEDLSRFEYSEKNCAVINTKPSLGIGKWIPKSCNDTNGFICQKDVDSAVNDPPEPTSSNNYFKILNDSIKLVPVQMSWNAAKKHCEADGAQLASVRTEWTQAYIELLAMNLNHPLWIGLNKTQINGYFRYIAGWRMEFTQWGKNEPRRNGNCVYVDVDGKWKTDDCDRNISSVCMKSTDTPPRDESKDFPGICPEDPDPIHPWKRYVWKPFRGFCYMFSPEEIEWQNAVTRCMEHGGVLASIADDHEQEFIQNNIASFQDEHTSYWLGLFRTQKGEWLWLDKTVMDYSNWNSAIPWSSMLATYGVIRAGDGTWTTGRRWNDRAYICKTAKVLPPMSSTVPPTGVSSQGRAHTALTAVLVIAGIAVGTGIAFFLFKKTGHHIPPIPIPGGLTAFDNPLFSNNRSQPDLVDTKNLVANVDEDNTQPVITI